MCVFVHAEGAVCVGEEDLGMQLDKWEPDSMEKQDPTAQSGSLPGSLPGAALEEALLFESKGQPKLGLQFVRKTYKIQEALDWVEG